MEDLSHRCLPRRAHLVFQPNRQVQEDADQPEGTKRLDRSERLQELHRRYAGTARQADCRADCSWPAGSERRRTRSSVAAHPEKPAFCPTPLVISSTKAESSALDAGPPRSTWMSYHRREFSMRADGNHKHAVVFR